MQFVLNDLLKIDSYGDLPGFADASPDLVDAILTEGAKIAEEVLHPLNQVGDRQGCHLENGVVRIPEGFKAAYDMYAKGGWGGLTSDPEYGGQGLPQVVGIAVSEMVSAANMAFSMYPGLTHGAYSAIDAHGSDEQKKMYLPNMVSGKWAGTMNLTEPHCGTDLGLMRTKAVPQDDGTYKITGTKIFISAGDHELTENIIHLVLAKIAGAPEGIKGVSLFIVPKYLVQEDGSLGARNGVTCGSLEEKMGIHGNSTCVLNYEGATGTLIGSSNKGMRAMFTMMNAARLGVGMQGMSQSEVSYQNAVAYAKERLQGRALTGPKAPDQAADPIIVHPDIRRMLMDQKAFNEGARALMYWTALQGDLSHMAPDEEMRQKADDLMGLITPVIKGYLTDIGFAHTVNAQQVLGGHGYIQESGLEQFVRDARITMIYEGANGVQALDLVGRKLASNGGRAIFSFLAELEAYLKEHEGDETIELHLQTLAQAKTYLEDATNWLMENGLKNPDNAGAASTDYLHLFGLVLMAWVWAQMAKAAQDKVANGAGEDPFYQNKLKTARYFSERIFPDAAAHLAKLKSGSDSMMALQAEDF